MGLFSFQKGIMSEIKERPPHQQRVIHERGDLAYKLERLVAFFTGDAFKALPGEEQGMLLDQRVHMERYLAILDRRVAVFDGSPVAVEATPTEPAQQAGALEIKDLDQALFILDRWHSKKVAELEFMLELPDGAVMQSESSELTLTGDVRSGFQAGLSLALMQLGTLPFAPAPANATVH